MQDLIETFDPSTCPNAHQLWCKQYRLFKALYDVAATYVDAKSGMGGTSISSSEMTRWHETDISSTFPDSFELEPIEAPSTDFAPTCMSSREDMMDRISSQSGTGMNSWTLHNAPFWDIDFGFSSYT